MGLRDRVAAYRPIVRIGIRNLGRHRLRSFLATLGILIGVLAIATLGVFGNVLQVAATDSLGPLGRQVIVSPGESQGLASISAGSAGTGQGFSSRDIQRIERAAVDGDTVVPLITGGGQVQRGSASTFAIMIGTNNPGDVFAVSRGYMPDVHRQGVLVGETLADQLEAGIGSTVRVNDQPYRVIGILEAGNGLLPISPGGAVVLPESAFSRQYSQVLIDAQSAASAERTAARIRSRFDQRRDTVSVLELSSWLDQIRGFFGLLKTVLLSLGGISLVVAGVSIFNVMLMSTAERRQEIGMLRAVGVERASVTRMLVTEATLLGVIGGLGGVALTILVATLFWWGTGVGFDVVFSLQNAIVLALAFAFGVVTSLLSGVYPARKAAGERPVDALDG